MNYFENNNLFIQQFMENRKTTITKLDLITNALCWNYALIFEFDWKINIFKNILLEIKNMEMFCHIDS